MIDPSIKKLAIAPQQLGTVVPDAPTDIDTKLCIARYTISSIAVDADGDVLVPNGSLNHLDRYRNNPVVLWCHDSEASPVAQSVDPVSGSLSWDVSPDNSIIKAYAKFHLKTLESSQVWGLVEAGILRGASVGYDAIPGKIQRLPSGGKRFLEWEPHEWSVCSVPVNPEALLDTVHRRWDGKALSARIVKSLMRHAPKVKNSRTTVAMNAGYVCDSAPWVKSNRSTKSQDATTMADDTQNLGSDDTTTNNMPPGAQAVAGFCADLETALANLHATLPMIEKEPILDLFEEVGTAIGEQVVRLRGAMGEIYPDLADGNGGEEEGEEIEEETEEVAEGEGKADDKEDDKGDAGDTGKDTEKDDKDEAKSKSKSKAKITKSSTPNNDHAPHLAAMADASDLCKEMGDSPNVPKSYRLACKSAHQGLTGASDWMSKAFAAKAEADEVVETAEEVKMDEDDEAVETAKTTNDKAAGDVESEVTEDEVKAIKALQSTIASVTTQLKSITGKV